MLYFMWCLCMDPWRVRFDLCERSEMAKGNVCEEWQITHSCVVEICRLSLHHRVLFGFMLFWNCITPIELEGNISPDIWAVHSLV